MTEQLITPSWQDVAERWQRAYLDVKDRLDRIADACDGFEADGHGDAVSITAIRAILEEQS